jgi:hypothetical protein
MNERIKELAQQAGLAWAEDVGCGFPDIKYPPGYERFAQLIIDACVKIADETDYILADRETVTVETKIETYFGVE